MDYLLYFGSAFATNLPQLVGFVMPVFIQVLNRDVQRESERYVVSVFACLIVALVLHWDKVAYGTPEQALASAGVVFLESNALYTLYFAKSGIRADLIRLIGGRSNLKEPLTEVTEVIMPDPVKEGDKIP